jgi:hypothetical protein
MQEVRRKNMCRAGCELLKLLNALALAAVFRRAGIALPSRLERSPRAATPPPEFRQKPRDTRDLTKSGVHVA